MMPQVPGAQLLNDWHVVCDANWLRAARVAFCTGLFGKPIVLDPTSGEGVFARSAADGRHLHCKEKLGFIWVCPGEPERDIPEVPEAEERDRHVLSGGSIGVHVSGLRVIENFIDMGHLPFVHAGWLGQEPQTEVAPYSVEVTRNGEILATECKIFQPAALPTASDGFVVDYVFEVHRPFMVSLKKANPVQRHRMDFILLLVQPVEEERCVVHSLLCYLKDGIDAPTVRWFMQLIFCQDKPILENQLPKRLPLDSRAEMPARADASSVAYRRWLREKGIAYGAIPA